MWKYDDDVSEDVIRTAKALENIQLDRKARNLTSSWRYIPWFSILFAILIRAWNC